MKTISIILEDELLNRVEDVAKSTERTRSWIIRRAVREYLKKERVNDEKTIKKN